MIGLTLKHLRYFEALATHSHFGRAAEACAISQPALSLQIKELEAMMGGPLVDRSARRVQLTALGEDFAQRARKILSDVDQLKDLARASSDAFAGRLRLGIIPTIAPYLLVDLLQALRARFPSLDVQPREAVTQSLIDDLQAGQLDVAVVALPVSEPSLQEFALFEEEFVLARPESDAGNPVPPAHKLRELRLLLLEEGHCFRDQALSFCDVGADHDTYTMEGSSLTTLVQMVGAGIGVTLLPEMAIDFETRHTAVAVSRFPKAPPSRSVGVIWRKSHVLAHHFMAVGAEIRKAAEARRAVQARGAP